MLVRFVHDLTATSVRSASPKSLQTAVLFRPVSIVCIFAYPGALAAAWPRRWGKCRVASWERYLLSGPAAGRGCAADTSSVAAANGTHIVILMYEVS